MYTLENNKTTPLCTLCTLIQQIILFLTLTLVRTWYEESTPGESVQGVCYVFAVGILKNVGHLWREKILMSNMDGRDTDGVERVESLHCKTCIFMGLL